MDFAVVVAVAAAVAVVVAFSFVPVASFPPDSFYTNY